jgi:hypothetical protein
MPMTIENFVSPGGIVKRSLAMVSCKRDKAIAKAFGLDAATPR